MKDILKELAKFIVRRNSKSYIKFLRKKGCTIGEGTIIYDPNNTIVDTTRACLIKIGNDVRISSGVTILAHGYDWSVLREVFKEQLGSAGKVEIGNNVFIGMHTTILKGVKVGNNVIIGANSLVNKDIPDNSVVAGNPAKVITTIDKYFEKRKTQYLNDAKELAMGYFEKFQTKPPVHLFAEFSHLFSEEEFKRTGFKLDSRGDKPMFDNYDGFLKWCGVPL